MLLIDAFNDLKKQLALLNMYVEFPAMTTFLTDLYRKPVNLKKWFCCKKVLLRAGLKVCQCMV